MKAEEEAEELLKEWVKKIDSPKIENKAKFLRYGVEGDFERIRKTIIEFKNPPEDKIEAFLGICDNKIDRLKSFSGDIITVVGFLIGFSAGIASTLVMSDVVGESFPLLEKLSGFIGRTPLTVLAIIFLIFILSLSLLLLRYRAQIYAWYAVKEGVLLMKKNK